MVENHLKDMILKSFDPKKADTIFTEEGKVRTEEVNQLHIRGISKQNIPFCLSEKI